MQSVRPNSTSDSERRRDRLAAAGLAVGAVAGMAGSFVGHEEARHLLWLLDGVGIVVAVALLAVKYLRAGNDDLAAGFLVFLAGQALVLSGAATDLASGNASFAAGIGLWAVSLSMMSTTTALPRWCRATGVIAAVLFAVSAVRIALGSTIVATTAPLPSAGYPFLVLTFVGWIRATHGSTATISSASEAWTES